MSLSARLAAATVLLLSMLIAPAGAVSPKTVQFVASFEGFFPCPYNDPAGHATIGYGHLLHYGPVNKADRKRWGCLSEAQGRALLRRDLAEYQSQVAERLVGVRVNPSMMTALTSFAFNLGPGMLDHRPDNGFTRRTDIAWHLRQSHYLTAARQMRIYDGVIDGGRRYVLPGLTRRRSLEHRLMLRGIRVIKKCRQPGCPVWIIRSR